MDSTLLLDGPLLVRSPNWLGDAVMALPAVRNLKNLQTRESLTVAAPEKLAELWRACPFVDEVLVLTEPRKIRVTAHQLRAGKFKNAVLLPNSFRSAAEVFLAGIPRRAGYARPGRGLLLSQAVPPPSREPLRLHQKFYYLDLAAALGAPRDETTPALRKSEAAPSSGPGPLVALCPGAEYGPAKRWPVENFIAVGRHFMAAHRARIVILGAPGDATLAGEVAEQLPGAENRAGKTSLGEFMAALADAQLVICNDSGAMHLSSVLNVPTVAIFGSTEPQLTGPIGTRTRVLRHHVPCSPCFLRDCPIDFGCMTGIPPEKAIAAGESLLKPT